MFMLRTTHPLKLHPTIQMRTIIQLLYKKNKWNNQNQEGGGQSPNALHNARGNPNPTNKDHTKPNK